MSALEVHSFPASRTDLLENLAVGAVHAYAVGRGSVEDAAAAFVDLDDQTVVDYLRAAEAISVIAGAQLYLDAWSLDEDPTAVVVEAAGIARAYVRGQL